MWLWMLCVYVSLCPFESVVGDGMVPSAMLQCICSSSVCLVCDAVIKVTQQHKLEELFIHLHYE